jgi:hypothetical protein
VGLFELLANAQAIKHNGMLADWTASLSIEMLLPEGSDHLVAGGESAKEVRTVEGRPLIIIPQTIPQVLSVRSP